MSAIELVHGPPGTGKTTYLARQARRAAAAHGPAAVAIASLTRAAAAEIGGRDTGIPAANAGTLHAACFNGLDRPRLAETGDGLRAFADAYPHLRLSGGRDGLDEPAGDHGASAGRTLADQLHGAVAARRARREPRAAWSDPEREFAALWEDWKRQTGRHDFTDLVERALDELPAHPAAPRVLLLDEAQDFSALELELTRRWAARTTTTVLCGDSDQALYQWRGSDPAALGGLALTGSRTLARSHRVPRAVHALAAGWIGQLPGRAATRYEPTARAGAVTRLPISLRWVDPLLRELEADLAAGRDAMVLTACGYQLAPVVRLLREHAIAFHNPYRRSARTWNPLREAGALTAFLRPSAAVWGSRARPWTWEDVRRWSAPLTVSGTLARGARALIAAKCERDRAGVARGGEAVAPETLAQLLADGGPRHPAQAFAEASDPAAAGRALAGGAACAADPAALAAAVAWWAARLRAGEAARHRCALELLHARGPAALLERPRVVLGTIHSVKGGEADVVYLFPDLSRQGMWSGWHVGGAGRAQIVRMVYVALTRARERVTLLEPSGPEHVGPLL